MKIETMGEREPVRSYLQKIIGEQAACRRRRDEIYKQNGQLLDKGLLLLGKSIEVIAKRGDRMQKGKPTPPTPIELNGQTPVFLSVSEGFAQNYDAIIEGVEISFMQDGERTVLFKILPWGQVENAQGQQTSLEELEIAGKVLDLLQNSSTR
ncbi:MAG: hypothetical protein HYS83_02020 [Candidatus Blackburnbacteria bacterium]|nr:hypothetical protein [Candidatus Blackburnbacteria bacterium]